MIAKLAVSGNDLIDHPYDGVDRYILDGELRENPSGAIDPETGEIMTVRNRLHSRTTTATARELSIWLRGQSSFGGEVLTGDAGVRLTNDPERSFGVDVMVVSAEVLAAQTGESTIVEGVPTLCVEILSPSGAVVQTLNLGAQGAGMHSFDWPAGSATDSSGLTFRVTATTGGVATPSTALMRDRVDAVSTSGNSFHLELEKSGSVPYSSVKALN